MSKRRHRVIVACRIMQSELEMTCEAGDNVEIRYIDQGFHMTPQKMASAIQEMLDLVDSHVSHVILGYGLCSNGIVGVTARQQRLIVPRCHDCIAFFLGSSAAYKYAFKSTPGTFYLPAGWVASRLDPLSIIEDEYTHRVGREFAIWSMNQELKHYRRIALIDTGVIYLASYRRRAKENARFFKKEYAEIKSTQDYFKRLLRGPYKEEEFIILEPGQTVTQSMFLNEKTTTKHEKRTGEYQ